MGLKLTRRQVLAASAAAGAGMLLPAGASAGVAQPTGAGPYWDRILILIELDGGNDGLNTVIPFNVAEYGSGRPSLKYTAANVSGTLLGAASYKTVTAGSGSRMEQFALNPAMTHLTSAWNPGTPATHDLAIVLGVGYANPNLSHFRSMDIWNGGSDPNQFPIDNWLGRLYAQAAVVSSMPSTLTAHGVLLSNYHSNPLKRDGVRYLAMSKPKDFIDRSFALLDTTGTSPSAHFQHLLTTQHEVYQAAAKFRAALLTPKVASPSPTNPNHWNYTPPTFSSPGITFNSTSSFEMRCKSIAEMIATNQASVASDKRLHIPVYKVQLGGFDNHTTQKSKHEDLLAQVSSAMSSLRAAMIEKGLWERVLIMTYSEFGRRVEENGSAGTDHGTANCHFLMGGGVTGGFYGQQPGLYNGSGTTDLIDDNLVANVDFRRLYSTAAQWLGLPLDSYLIAGPGEDFSPLGCLA